MDLIGQMRKKVSLCINIPNAQGSGYTDNYGILLETRGKLKQDSGNRNLTAGEIEGNKSYTLITRFQSSIESNITISAKWLIDGVFYTIDTWSKEDDQTFLYYKFRLSKKEKPEIAPGSLIPIDMVSLKTLNLSQSSGNSVSMGVVPDGIFVVTRSGLLYNLVTGTPSGLQVKWEGMNLVFEDIFNAGGEPVYVLYK